MTEKPLILVTNDDGVLAPGLRHLIEIMNEFGEVWVVAPDSPQSGKGHAITINTTIGCQELQLAGPQRDFSCSGTPVDCVKFALDKLLPRRPSLCVSGINHGSNSAINVIYSGTMSAAVEAGVEGIPAIGFSLGDYAQDADFTQTAPFVRQLVRQNLAQPMPNGVVLNVNFPINSGLPLKGLKVCRQAKAKWDEEFDERISPYGKTYYWLTGQFVNQDPGEDTDEYALANGFVSVVPVQFDLTAYQHLAHFEQLLGQNPA
jgi:5'-nucleotidase